MEVQESSDFERLSCVARMPAVDRWIHHYHQSIDTGWCFGVLTHFMMLTRIMVLTYGMVLASTIWLDSAVGTKDEVIQLF